MAAMCEGMVWGDGASQVPSTLSQSLGLLVRVRQRRFQKREGAWRLAVEMVSNGTWVPIGVEMVSDGTWVPIGVSGQLVRGWSTPTRRL